MATFKFELVSPERLVLSADVEQVDLPGTEGDFGVLAGHSPVLSTLKTGMITVKSGAGTDKIYVRGGFADVGINGLTVLAEKAINAADLKPEVVASEIKLAEDDVAAAKTPEAKDKAVAALEVVKAVLSAA
ncbi:F0F1 ATP synthase subunit epsilon [Oryzibacter oryziterrae]|uniref:F0F1 ATP synthase subunit epsilon n=1 Tax=Oryzibacter oryziterrae TaxID=2766474 RepID=UPI001F01F2F3|nr:F0F1 ATP synthase subunit epsilon [Oryzibacter oryziterrae]